MRDKAAWSEAARGDPDVLSLDEFLAFKHPESSHATILGKVEELLAAKDGDSDSQITLEEYMAAAEEQEQEQADQKQFKETDADGNGKLSRKELLLYMDPRHPHHARVEAESLMAAADSDTDGKLTLAELLQQSSIFAASKMVDAASSFHNEF
uniref:45 kDa calcium-binding protein-like n=1 Tax=Hirondellea gigas TaxID=1518452 RepID=A0A2P2HYU9_9CRUS